MSKDSPSRTSVAGSSVPGLKQPRGCSQLFLKVMPSGGLRRAAAASSSFFFRSACSADMAHSIRPQKSTCVCLFQSPFGAVKTSGPKEPRSSLNSAEKT